MSRSSTDLKTLLPLPVNGRGIGYICAEILNFMSNENVTTTLFTPYSSTCLSPNIRTHNSLNPYLGKVLNRYASRLSTRMTEAAFLRNVRNGGKDVAYLWSETTLGFAQVLKRRGIPVVREKYNTAKALAKRILDDAYRRIGVAPQHRITEKDVAEEEIRLKLADAVFCPSPLVKQSLADIGIVDSALLATSYGFCPSRITTEQKLLPPVDGTTFVFVGSICVRKGAHLLLEAWAKSGIRGRLVLAGSIEQVIERHCAAHLARPDVVRLPYVKKVGELFNSADVFVFPSLEEGAPLVTYEAAACGLPAIVSPMGASQIIRSGKEGYVLEPYDIDSWIDAMREMATNSSMRDQFGTAAKQRSSEFTWAHIGSKRRELLAPLCQA